MKNIKTSFLIILCTFIIAIFFYINNHRSITWYSDPIYYLKNSNYQIQEILYQQDLSDNRTVIFFLKNSDTISCVVLTKNLFSYKIRSFFHDVTTPNEIKKANFLYLSYPISYIKNKRESLNWGVIDKSIDQVYINGKKTTIINIPNYSFNICYFVNIEDDSSDIEPNFTYKIIEK